MPAKCGFTVTREDGRNMLNVYRREDGTRHAFELADNQVLNVAHDLLGLIYRHMEVESRR